MSATEINKNLKLMSHSSDIVLHQCPRKFELYKLSPPATSFDDDDDEYGGHLNFGKVVGAVIQDYLQHGNLNKSIMKTFMTWTKGIDDEAGVKARKTFWHALYALDKFVSFRMTQLSQYELVYFENKPAIELGFQIDLGDGFVYRGFLDALLFDKLRNELVVGEFKTTKSKEVHEAVYKHSGQPLSYSLVIDSVAKLIGKQVASSMKICYMIYKTYGFEWELMPFTKTYTQRAMWIKNLLIDKETIIRNAEQDYFPMQGESCFSFFRPCKFFGMCELSNKSLQLEDVPVKEDDPKLYTFKFHINDIIEAQLKA